MKKIKKAIVFLLTLMILSGTLIVAPITVSAAKDNEQSIGYNLLTEEQFSSKISELKIMYPANSAPDYTYYENGQALAWTCHGFANKMAYYCFGCSMYTYDGGYSKSWDSSYFNAGDIVRINNDNHTIFITYAVGNTIKYAEGNYDGIVRWDVTTSLEDIQNRFTYKVHLNGNNLTGSGYPYVDFNKDFMVKIIKMNDWVPVVNEGTNTEIGVESGNANEYWWIARQPDRSFTIKSMSDGKYLDVDCSRTENGTNIHVYNKTDTDNQKFYFKATNNGYVIIPKIATSSCLDVQSDGKAKGTNIHLWEQNGTMAQRFALYEYPSVPEFENIGTDFVATILKTKDWVPLVNKDTNVEIGKEHLNANERWRFHRLNDGTYTIKSMEDGNYLDLDCSQAVNGTNIHVYRFTNTDNQKYYIKKARLGGYVIIPKCAPNHRLDVVSDGNSEGFNIQLWEANGTDAQIFSIYKFPDTPDFINLGNEFTASLITFNNNYALTNSDSNVIADNIDNKKDKYWKFIRNSDGSYSIMSLLDNTYLEISNDDNKLNTLVYTDNFTGNVSQRFYIEPDGEYFRIIPQADLKLSIGISDNAVEQGDKYTYTSRSNSTTQLFNIKNKEQLLGDANNDGNVDVLDAAAIQKYSSGKADLTTEQLAVADVNDDNNVDVLDAAEIQKYASGIITEFKKKV